MGTYYKDAMVLPAERRREYFRRAVGIGISEYLAKRGIACSMQDLQGLLDGLMIELAEGRIPSSDVLSFGLATAAQYFSFEDESALYEFIDSGAAP